MVTNKSETELHTRTRVSVPVCHCDSHVCSVACYTKKQWFYHCDVSPFGTKSQSKTYMFIEYEGIYNYKTTVWLLAKRILYTVVCAKKGNHAQTCRAESCKHVSHRFICQTRRVIYSNCKMNV